MKTITTLIGLLLLSGVAFANSTLSLVLNGGNSFTVYLDGEKYQTSSTIRFQGLFPGRHTLSVINKDLYNPTSLYNGFVDIEDGEALYGVVSDGNLTISTQRNNNTNQNPFVNQNNCNEYQPSGHNNHQYGMNQQVFNQLHHDFSFSTDSRKAKMLINKAQRHGISSNQAKQLLNEFSFDSQRLSTAKQLTGVIIDRQNYWTVGETFTFSSNKQQFLRHLNNSNYNHNGNPNGNCIPRPNPNHPNHSFGMNQDAFQTLKRVIRDESFDNKKKQQVLVAVKHGKISAQQMTQLLTEFTFDSNRLETAKAVIPFISDKENYWMAGEAFTFSSNKSSFLKALN
jgi:hypothetical protein